MARWMMKTDAILETDLWRIGSGIGIPMLPVANGHTAPVGPGAKVAGHSSDICEHSSGVNRYLPVV